MKKLFLSSLILSAHFMSAQLNRGTFLLGGDVGYYQNKSDQAGTIDPRQTKQNDQKNIGLSLDAGYFVAPNFAIGVFGAYQSYSYSTDERGATYIRLDESKQSQSSFGAFARAYKLFDDNKFGFFAELRGGYLMGNYERKYFYQQNIQPSQVTNSVDKGPGFTVGIRPGFVYFVRPRIGIEASFGNLSYVSQKLDNSVDGEKTATTKSNTLNLNLNVTSISLGVHLYLGGKQ